MGTPDNRKYAADESPEINVVNKIKDCLPSYRSLRVVSRTFFIPLDQFDACIRYDILATSSPRRSKLQAHQFFTFDSVRRCIRPLLAPDGPPFPRLSSWLARDLQRRIISLNDLTWSLILHETTDVGTVDDTPFVSWFTRSSYWYLFDSKVLCLNQLSSLLPYSFSTWSSQKWQQFWSLEIAPEVRSLWYRFFYNKLHCQVTVSRFDPQVTAMCNFCQDAPEDLRHLFVDCHQKWSIWQTVLSQFAPYLEFQQDDVYAILMNLLQNIYIY
ncbi:hypothetical protein G6F32_008588 [Rhizopus arrhizus]|nr:hypothetical protein G6F32_008588 [Rhizopus arrhizus]